MPLSKPLLKTALLLTLGTLLATTSTNPQAPQTKPVARPDLVFVQAPIIQDGTLPDRFPKGSQIFRLAAGTKVPVNLTAGFLAAADPEVSFDGAKILFAAKRDAAAAWQIWEMNVDGSGQRQVTQSTADCLHPAYLPRDEIVYTAVSNEAGETGSQLYVCKRDGTEAHPITFGPGDFEVETVLQNGMILASARSPLLPPNTGQSARELYTLRPDGSGLGTFRCDHRQPADRAGAVELEDGSVVYVKRQVNSRAVGGELAMIRRGAVHNTRLGISPVLAWSPRPLAAEQLIVARRQSPAKGDLAKLDLYSFDSARGNFGDLIYRDAKLSSAQAVPVAAHSTPRWYWSTLNPALHAGYFICLDAHLSSAAPKGRFPDALAKVRVLTLESDGRQERTLGEAPIEKDGSFYLAVPPDRPVRFELLDASGQVVQAQRSWIWSRAGEEHGCVGCHEDRAVAPENRWPMTLRRFDTPTRLGVETAGASSTPAPAAAH